MDSSRIEQEIAVSDNVVAQVAAIVELLNTVKVDSLDALRLLMVFTLRYEKTRPEKVREVRSLMETRGVLKHSEMAYVDWLLAFGGANVRTGDLFGEASTSALNKFVSAIKPMADVENVYTQHQPAMLSLLSDVAKNKLKPAVYPFTATETPMKYNTVIVFVVGGVTYEEAAMVAAINAGMLSVTEKRVLPTPVPPPFRVVLGGTNIQNSASFMAELQQMQAAGAGAAAGAGTGFM
ncbi:hypothetical protein EON67_01850 [archaeon]|nr:MAG: hypothetical protein EON67_01850 [archaeon]